MNIARNPIINLYTKKENLTHHNIITLIILNRLVIILITNIVSEQIVVIAESDQHYHNLQDVITIKYRYHRAAKTFPSDRAT